MKITVLDRYRAMVYVPNGRAAIIRIGDTIDEVSTDLEGNFEKEYRFSFHDLTHVSANIPSNWKIFSIADGEEVLKAFEEIEGLKMDEVIVHCHAGISRSPAVAIALGIYFKQEGIIEQVFEKPILPNSRVIDVMFATMKQDRDERRRYRNQIRACIEKSKEEKMKSATITF